MPWLFLQPELLGPFFIIVGALVLIGLAQTLTAQHGSHSTAGWWETFKAQLSLSTYTGYIADFTRYVVSRFAGAHLKTLAHWLRAMGTVTLGAFITPAENALAIEEALRSLFTRGDPKARRAARKAQATATHGVHVARRAQVAANAGAQALRRYKALTNPRIHHLTHAADVALPRDIAGLRARNKALADEQAKQRGAIAGIEHGAADVWDWLRSHPLSAATGAFAGAVVFALSRLGYGFLRCKSWRSLGRRITCGMGAWLHGLLDLIGIFALSLLAVLKPEVLARVAVKAVDVVEPQLERMLSQSTSESAIEAEVDKLLSWLGIG